MNNSFSMCLCASSSLTGGSSGNAGHLKKNVSCQFSGQINIYASCSTVFFKGVGILLKANSYLCTDCMQKKVTHALRFFSRKAHNLPSSFVIVTMTYEGSTDTRSSLDFKYTPKDSSYSKKESSRMLMVMLLTKWLLSNKRLPFCDS